MKTSVSVLSLLAAFLVGCNSNKFSHQIADADRVVLSGHFVDAVEITVTGDKAREIINTVASAKRLTGRYGRPEMIGIKLLNEVRFYQGTNLLGRIDTSLGLFTTGGVDSYEADKEKMTSLVDDPIMRAMEEKQRQKR